MKLLESLETLIYMPNVFKSNTLKFNRLIFTPEPFTSNFLVFRCLFLQLHMQYKHQIHIYPYKFCPNLFAGRGNDLKSSFRNIENVGQTDESGRKRERLGIKLGSTFPFCNFHSETKTKTWKKPSYNN